MKRLFKKQVNKQTSKKKIILVIFLVAVGFVLCGVLISNKLELGQTNQCRAKASSPIYVEATPLANDDLLTPENEEIALKIEQNKGYKDDINCLYPLINYYSYKKDTNKVKTLFGLYGLAYGEDRKSEKMYKDYDVRSYEDVERQVDAFIENEGSVDAIFY